MQHCEKGGLYNSPFNQASLGENVSGMFPGPVGMNPALRQQSIPHAHDLIRDRLINSLTIGSIMLPFPR
jgi:hypothetical protein